MKRASVSLSLPPRLFDSHRKALEDAASRLFDEFTHTLTGLLVAGSVGKGSARQTSDVDLHVVFDGSWSQRRRVFFGSVAVDIFIDPCRKIDREMSDHGNFVLVRNYAEGWILYDPKRFLHEVKGRARHTLNSLHSPPAEGDVFMHVNRLRDALANISSALKAGDSVVASHQFCFLISQAFDGYFHLSRGWRPASKDLIDEIDRRNPALARMMRELLDFSTPISEKEELASAMVEEVLKGYSGMPAMWCSPKIPDNLSYQRVIAGTKILKVPRV